jgi:glycogen(starch) synthase
MRILMFGWEFPPYNSGGLGVACFGLTRALAEFDLQITFVLPRRVSVSAPFLKMVFADNKVKMLPVDAMLSPYMTQVEYKYARFLDGSPIYGSSLFEEVLRYASMASDVAKNEEFDVIHAHDWLSFLAGVEAKKVSGKPLIVHVHATEFDRSGEHVNQAIYNIEKEGMEQANKIIAVSQFTKDIIVSRYGISPDKIEVVWNGIDQADYYDQPSEQYNNIMRFKELGFKIVLFVGRITMQKGPDYFLDAAKKVLECEPNTVFIIAGSGDMENQIMMQAASLGISDKVLFPGFLRGAELNKVYKAADLFVLPSVSEPFGIVPLESVINGTPVLISKQSGVSECLTHSLQVDFWDTDEMANQIVSVLYHTSLKECLRDNSQKEIKKLTWHEAAKKCAKIYHNVVYGGN